MLTITTISDFRNDTKLYPDRLTKNVETPIINRGKDSGVVIISLEDNNKLKTNNHELPSKINEKRNGRI
jgi:antitoxin YefM